MTEHIELDQATWHGGPPTSGTPEEVLDAVRHTVLELLSGIAVPPSLLKVRSEGSSIELRWPEPATAPGPARDPAVGPAPEAGTAEPDDGLERLGAPTVGVFYRASEPGRSPFVTEGDVVGPGQQIAIVEAMKLMIPVEADRDGRIVEVLVPDGTPVEFGQPLFTIAPLDND
jgi:acetyl-CoA carboxylase biotin carboxyl carrier protein